MKECIILLLCIISVSCIDKRMTNDEIIGEINKCKGAGLDYGIYENWDDSTRMVKCK